MNILIQERAEEELNNKLQDGQFLRVGVTPGGCAGLTYSAELGSNLGDDEGVVFQSGKIRVVADVEAVQFLDGLVIDYSDDLLHGGLQFTNQKSKGSCGCGQSFKLAGFPEAEPGQCHH